MNKVHIHIDGIKIRAKGIAAIDAHGIADGLGELVADALAARGIAGPNHPSRRINELEIGRITGSRMPVSDIRAEIASRVADSVAGRTESKGT